MPPEIAALIDKPLLLLLVLAAGAIPAMFAERLFERFDRERRRARWQQRNGKGQGRVVPWRKEKTAVPLKGTAERATIDASEQLRFVMEADFKARALLNRPERRLLAVIDQALASESPGWRAMGQVSLGEILWSDDKDAFGAINSKRVDLLIVDADCTPLHAVEFQGTGHHMGKETAARDAVKKEALRRAGIGYIEVVSGDTPTQVRDMVRRLVGKSR